MFAIILSEIEKKISQLSYEEQLWLVERLVRQVRKGAMKNHSSEKELFKNQLVTMANDPELQAELKKIDQEFAVTEADGLARV